MHIQSYLDGFSSMNSNEKRNMQTIFSNLTQSRKSLSRVYLQQTEKSDNSQTHNNKKSKQTHLNNQFDFNDTTLYKTTLRIPHERNNTIGTNQALSFKLTYVQHHRPVIKQKIVKKMTQQPTGSNLTIQPKQSRVQVKKSRIQKFIARKKQDPKSKFINTRDKPLTRDFFKQRLLKFSKPSQPVSFQNQTIRHQTLPARKIKSSLDTENYRLCTKQSIATPRYNQSGNSKYLLEELPDYAKNIMKPCKIQGMELLDRPKTSFRKHARNLSSPFRKGGQGDVWEENDKGASTARDQRDQKPRRSRKTIKLNLQKILESQTQKKGGQFEPWHQDQNNEEQNDHHFC